MTITVWILGDQLLANHPALAAAQAAAGRSQVRVVLVESRQRGGELPYQRKKLVLLFSAMRHYAAALQAQGYAVNLLQADTMLNGLQNHIGDWQPQRILCMQASEYAGRRFQEALARKTGLPVTILPNTQFLCGQFDPFSDAPAGKRVVMGNFYKAMRKNFAVLITPDGKPVGGQWNYDLANRRPLPKGLHPPERIGFQPDEITLQAMEQINRLDSGVGSIDGFNLAVTHAQAEQALQDFLDQRLDLFGPFEDAMSDSEVVFHSMLSPYLNIGLLEPMKVAQMAAARYETGQARLQSVEGFIRQVIGWREFIYWQYWRQMPDLKRVNFWQVNRALPEFFWNAETDMNCLRQVIGHALRTGYTHHIERLMVISNYCLLTGIDPQQVNDWFSSCYIDAYEWVMLPNVLGMGLYADGGQTATKPYIASANYINKMSPYCQACHYAPKRRHGERACPFNLLYWNFLIEHEALLRSNPRMGANVLGLSRLSAEERLLVQKQAQDHLCYDGGYL